jgi:addiction module HigA family antidote
MAKKGLPAIHPGEFLAETLGELGFSQAAFARAIGVSPMRISHVIKGARPVTAELALLFGRALNHRRNTGSTSRPYDLKPPVCIGPRLRAIHSVAHAYFQPPGQ